MPQDVRAIAFFPWWRLDRPLQLGPVRLLPYEITSLPGDQDFVSQQDIDGVIGAYALRPGARVKRCALLELDNWKLGQDPESVLETLFAAQHAIGFSSLSCRRLFAGHFGYASFDNFRLVVQRYRAGNADTFSFVTRRRDGGTRQLWSSDEFAFQRPLHVNESFRLPMPEAAMVSLLLNPSTPKNWKVAVAEFNLANTDSSGIPTHVELVMMKSAFELILGCGQKAQDFERSISDLLPSNASGEISGRLVDAWSSAYPKSKRPLEAWAREFCARRGSAAHFGNADTTMRCIWSEEAHLAFASVLFPIALKKLASNLGVYTMTREDALRIERVDDYLLEDPFSLAPNDHADDEFVHPWCLIDEDIRIHASLHEAKEAMNAGIASVIGSQIEKDG